VVRDVLRATVAELARVGFGALRVEDVAALAGVNKTTIYRRWPLKTDLVAAAIGSLAGSMEPLPDTGSLDEDLVELVGRTVRLARTPEGRAIMRLIVTEGGDPEVDTVARRLRDEAHRRRGVVIERAQARGELPRGLDASLVLDAIFAPVMSRLIRFREEVDEATIRAFVALVLDGARHAGGATRA